MKDKKAFTAGQIVLMILALLALLIMLFIVFKTKEGSYGIIERLKDLF